MPSVRKLTTVVLIAAVFAFSLSLPAQARRIKGAQAQKPEWLNIYPTTDQSKISALRKIFRETVWDKSEFLARDLQFVVAEDTRSNKIVGGFSYLFPSTENSITIIGLMAVAPERQKEGTGSFLAQEFFNIARNLGYRTIRLRVMDEALPFWLRYGGRIIQEVGNSGIIKLPIPLHGEVTSNREYIVEFDLE